MVPMPKKRRSPEQIAAALRQAEAGTPLAEITRKVGVHENTFYLWKKALRPTRDARDPRTASAARRELQAQANSSPTSRWTRRCCRTCWEKKW
jgi:transposase